MLREKYRVYDIETRYESFDSFGASDREVTMRVYIFIELMLVRQDGSYIQARTMQHASSVIHYELGVKDFTFHSLRHTHATMLAEAGMPQKYTQQRLGHKDISVTLKYYTHLTDKMSEIGGKILESMFADNDDD